MSYGVPCGIECSIRPGIPKRVACSSYNANGRGRSPLHARPDCDCSFSLVFLGASDSLWFYIRIIILRNIIFKTFCLCLCFCNLITWLGSFVTFKIAYNYSYIDCTISSRLSSHESLCIKALQYSNSEKAKKTGSSLGAGKVRRCWSH